jgi:hypothetical protein
MKTRRSPISYSADELAFLEERKAMPRPELHAAFVAEFGRDDVSFDNLKALMKRKGWMTGRDGCFPKGNVPWTKGRKLPFNANSARTQFKPGHRGGTAEQVYKPIGYERMHKHGYVERKINDDFPMQSRWKFVHVLRWEEAHGAIPDGHVLKCVDGDRANTDPSNWTPVPKGLVPKLSLKRGYDAAPVELKPTIMALAKLDYALAERTKKQEEEAC